MTRLKRKIDDYLVEWQKSDLKMPLIVKGARQIGKTNAIRYFGENHYKNFVEINFALNPEYKSIFDQGFNVDTIIKNISFINNDFIFETGSTLIFFDELQDCINCATSLKAFNEDHRYDVICSGSMMGINYQEIESNSVGNKLDYVMYSLDFEEFLWAKGYSSEQIDDLYMCMVNCTPLSTVQYNTMRNLFYDYMVVGGMPAIVNTYIVNKNFSGILMLQQQILQDYEEDIAKYAVGVDKARVLNAYRKISVFLGNENKKFQISKLAPGARNREYAGVSDWLESAGIVNISYCLSQCALPLKGNYDPNSYRVYFSDTGLLVGSLDEESQDDLRHNKNFNTYKGALYENIVGDMLVKQGYHLYFYKNEKGTIEMDFFIRDKDSLIPLEVKAGDNSTVSLKQLITNKQYKDIKYGIKLCDKNIGFNGNFYTFPYFLTFLLKRYMKSKI